MKRKNRKLLISFFFLRTSISNYLCFCKQYWPKIIKLSKKCVMNFYVFLAIIIFRGIFLANFVRKFNLCAFLLEFQSNLDAWKLAFSLSFLIFLTRFFSRYIIFLEIIFLFFQFNENPQNCKRKLKFDKTPNLITSLTSILLLDLQFN